MGSGVRISPGAPPSARMLESGMPMTGIFASDWVRRGAGRLSAALILLCLALPAAQSAQAAERVLHRTGTDDPSNHRPASHCFPRRATGRHRSVHRPDDARQSRPAGTRLRGVLDGQSGRQALHLHIATRHDLVGWCAADRGGFRLVVQAGARSEDRVSVRLAPVPDPRCARGRRGRKAGRIARRQCAGFENRRHGTRGADAVSARCARDQRTTRASSCDREIRRGVDPPAEFRQ